MKNLIALLILCLWFFSCGKGDTQDFETTIRVVDMSDKPLKGRMVKLYTDYTDSYSPGTTKSPTGSAQTDVNGQVLFKYRLTISDSHSDFASFITDDDAVWKVISYPNHSVSSSKTKKQELKIVMDSLMPLKVRLQKTSPTALQLNLFASTTSNAFTVDTYTRNKDIHKTFFGWNRLNTGVFDSLLVFNVFSKASMAVSASFVVDTILSNGTKSTIKIGNQSAAFSQGQRRDSVVHLIMK